MEKSYRKSMAEATTLATAMENVSTFSLPKRKVKVIPIKRHNPMTLTQDSENVFLYGRSHKRFTLPVRSSGNFVDPFQSEEERNVIEKELFMEKGSLSVNKKEKNFWKESFKGVILDKKELILDLSNPNDYIKYCVLMTNKSHIAPNEDLIKGNPSFQYAIVDIGYEDVQGSIKTDKLTDAAIEFSKIRNDRQSLVDTLYLLKPSVRVPVDANIEWIKSQVGEFMTKDPDKFLKIINDPTAQTRILIAKAIHAKSITVERGIYRSADRILGISLDTTIAYLNDPSNADLRSVLETQVIAAR